MKKINIKSFLTGLVIVASLCSYAFLYQASSTTINAANAKVETATEVALPDVSVLGKAADFIMDNLAVD